MTSNSIRKLFLTKPTPSSFLFYYTSIASILLPSSLVPSITHAFSMESPSATNTKKGVPDMTTTLESSRSIPKEENGILDLWKAYPDGSDGRGVKIAVMDTGCDLGSAGLQVTSNNEPKYLDFLDCTGDGDLDTSKTAKINSTDWTVVGKSGRTLLLGDWASQNSLEEVRIGGVELFRLLPTSVKTRLQNEHSEQWERDHRALLSSLQQELEDLETQIGKSSGKNEEEKSAKNDLIIKQKDTKVLIEKLETSVRETTISQKNTGPYMDLVVYKEADTGLWRVAFDLECNGDLRKSIPMTSFAIERQMGKLGFGAEVTFCVQVYDDGETISIVTDAGSHGTHVAGICAAHFPTDDENGVISERDGVAPGAQILACKIGDGRLGSAETGTGLIRALIAAKTYGCDLVNLSYGEPYWSPHSGRVADTFAKAVKEWGLTVFTSAGNDGPALSSLGAPGCQTEPITVGAYVSPDMMIDQYSTLPPPPGAGELKDTSYYFSSRGPTPDGSLPDICAPGGAIAPIPRHALQGKAQYHGTSMSSPNACGTTACILSTLKTKYPQEVFSPTELRRGLLNSAASVGISDVFAQGAGLISAKNAVDYISKYHGSVGQDLIYDVSIPSCNNARGIYLRDITQIDDAPKTFTVLIRPQFQHALKRTQTEMDALLGFELDLNLKPTASWIRCPERLTLMSAQERNGQSFAIRLDTSELSPGAHYATVDAIDASDPQRGALFQVPVTVIIPHETESITGDENASDVDFLATYELSPGSPSRRFIKVPAGAEWATIKVKSQDSTAQETSPVRVLLHAIPFVRGDLPNTEIQLKKLISVTEDNEETYQMQVKGDSTMELCLQLLWLANAAPCTLSAEVTFHSLGARNPFMVTSHRLLINPARGFARMGVFTPLCSERLKPKASLARLERNIRPKYFNIVVGSKDRDTIPVSLAEAASNPSAPGTKIYEMTLTYEFELKSDVDVVCSIPSLFNQLYDSPLDSHLWQLTDSNGQCLSYGSAMHQASASSLKKGNYTVSFFTRHPDRQNLELMKDTSLQISISLSTPLSCKVYEDMDKASTPSFKNDGRKELGSKLLRKGAQQDVYVARPTEDMPSEAQQGDILVGSLQLNTDLEKATAVSMVYPVPEKPKSENKMNSKIESPEPKETEDEKSLAENLKTVIFDSKVTFLATLRKDEKKKEDFEELSRALRDEKPDSLPLLKELLTFAVEQGTKNETSPPDRVKALQDVLGFYMSENGGPIDTNKLAQFFGLALPPDDDLELDAEAKKLKQEMEDQRKALQKVLLELAFASSEVAMADKSLILGLKEATEDLNKWASKKSDTFSDKKEKLQYWLVQSRYARLCKKRIGGALSIIFDAKKDLGVEQKAIQEELVSVYEAIEGSDYLVKGVRNQLFKQFPP